MEKTKQKSRKDKQNKYVDKDKSSTFIDVKTLKENLKIREILRTVKMNSSMRIKAPRGSKVMQNKDFSENDEFEDTLNNEYHNEVEPTCATNTILNTEIDGITVSEENYTNNETNSNANVDKPEFEEIDQIEVETSVLYKSKSLSEGLEDGAENNGNAHDDLTVLASLSENYGVRSRDRKLSLDHTMLSKREGLSQSEMDLHSIGKSPLERKSSFFKKKMNSFLKNTTEIFKRQSLGNNSLPSPSAQRRGSTCSRMSVSLQSLNENSENNKEYNNKPLDDSQDHQGSALSLLSSTPLARTDSSVSVNGGDRPPDMSEEESLSGSHQGLVGSQPLPDTCSTSIPGLNEGYMEESFWNSRAISMSSGLDTATGQRRRRGSKSNRVSWLASESLTDYFRRLIQDEKSQEYLIPEDVQSGPRTDSKGRRLSYVRAVSGEDPALPSRSQDSSLRKKKIRENEGHARPEVETLLAIFSMNGVPPLFGYTAWQVCPESNAILNMLEMDKIIDEYFQWDTDIAKQEVLKELIFTEAIHIRHLKVIVQVYIAAAHSLQSSGALMDVNTSVLFLNIPDILNANIRFWERAIFPMLADAKKNETFLNTSLMMQGFNEFAEIFDPYEEYMQNQKGAVDYLRSLNIEQEFMTYLTWCDQQTENRLQLADMLVKPMQRLTKYTLIMARLSEFTVEEDKKVELEIAESHIKSFLIEVNRGCRQKEELDILCNMKIEPYEPDFRGDEETEKAYKKFSTLNLLLPMVDCAPNMLRCLIHEADLRYKDHQKEFDAHVILFTDMMLICKKLTKTPKNANHWKMQRPKVLLHRTVPNIKAAKPSHDALTLIYVILDEQGCAQGVFQLSETSKDPNPTQTIKLWESKFYEAMMSYALTKWYYKYPVTNLAVVEKEYNGDFYKKEHPDICAMEKRARDRVAAMLHPNKRLTLPDNTPNIEIPLTAFDREKGPSQLHTICEPGLQNFNAWQARSSTFRRQTTDGQSSHTSTEAQASISGGSRDHDEATACSLQRSGSSVEQYYPQHIYEDVLHSPSIRVNVVLDSDCPTLVPSRQPSPPILVLQRSSPNNSPGPRSASAGCGSQNTLRVVSPSHSMVHSLPDINSEFHRVPEPRIIPQTASEKLYRSHQELMERNRLAASQHYLSPDHRGSSYPPPSPTRPLKRGLAFSYSFKTNPPLARSKNVHSISQNVQHEIQKLADVPRRILGRKSPQPTDPHKAGSRQRSPSPSMSTYRGDLNVSSTSMDKPDKKKSLFQRRSKDSTKSASPERTRGEQNDDDDYDADDDRSRRSSKSTKGEKGKLKVEACILEDQDSATGEEHEQSEDLDASGKPVKKNKDKG